MVESVRLAALALTIFTGLLSLVSFAFGLIAHARGIECAELAGDTRYGAATTIGLAVVYVALGWLLSGTCGG